VNPVRGRWPGADHPRGWAAWDGGHVETAPAPVEAVWHALSDNDARDQWFSAGSALDARAKSHEFRVGGHGTEEGQWHGGPESRFLSTYTDIVDLQRIVFTYDMWVDALWRKTLVSETSGDKAHISLICAPPGTV